VRRSGAKRGTGLQPVAFERARARNRGGKRDAGRVWGARGGREREERGGPGAAGDGSDRRHRPPAGGRGRWGASDASAMADKWGRATAGPGGQWLGAGG
jgi:hypothetical protein